MSTQPSGKVRVTLKEFDKTIRKLGYGITDTFVGVSNAQNYTYRNVLCIVVNKSTGVPFNLEENVNDKVKSILNVCFVFDEHGIWEWNNV